MLDGEVREAARRHLARTFGLPVDEMQDHRAFFRDLGQACAPGFDAYTRVYDDLLAVAHPRLEHDLRHGTLLVASVGTYCDMVAASYLHDRAKVAAVIAL
ncbi:hypothetical protein BH10PSE17_BH10PSE17_03010 [soil metagenome]